MAASMMTTANAPRDVQELVKAGRAQLYMLGLSLNMFANGDEEKAFLQNDNTQEQAQMVLSSLSAQDAAGGQAPPLQPPTTPATAAAVPPMAPAQMTLPQAAPVPIPAPVNVAVPAAPVQPQPLAATPMPVQPMPTAAPQVPQVPAPPVAPQPQMPQMPQPPPPQPQVPQAVAMPQVPTQMAPAAPFPPQPTLPAQMPPAPASQRQPSSATDPTNLGAVPMAAPGATPPNLAKLLKDIHEELETCAGVSEVEELKNIVLGVAATQNVMFIMLLELAQNQLAVPKDAIIKLIATALQGNEPEKWLEQAIEGGGPGK